MTRERGRVKWFDERRGYGFIERGSGEDAFVHFSEIQESGYRWLREGEEVEFEVVEDTRGPKAVDVVRVGGDTEPTVRRGRVRTLSDSRAQMREARRALAERAAERDAEGEEEEEGEGER